jgi:hypothetical protein
MSTASYRMTINGFRCHNETWDDPFEADGKRDEVFLHVNTKRVAPNGTIKRNLDSQSETMGDTLRQPGRVQAGSGSDRGGIRTNDSFPATATPWLRTQPLDGHRYPPYVIWEGDFAAEDIVMLTPTIWEYDPAESFVENWIKWHVETDDKFGQRAKDIFTKICPTTAPIFDAVSLGIQTAGQGARPVGTAGAPDVAPRSVSSATPLTPTASCSIRRSSRSPAKAPSTWSTKTIKASVPASPSSSTSTTPT